MSLREQHFTIAGRSVRCLEAGEGEPVLLVHAFPLSADLWRPQLDAPPPGWRLIAPDLRGFRGPGAGPGGAAPPGEVTVDDYARDLVAVLDHVGVARAVVAGVSMGGYVAFAMLRQAPDRVRALVLADTRPQADAEEGRAKRREMLALIDRGGVDAVAGTMLPALVGRTSHRERPEVVDEVRRLILANHPDAVRAAVSAMMTRPDSTPLLASIACPTLVVVGEEDVITPVADATALHDAIAGSRLAVLPEAGHLASLETPAAFDAALARFLAERVA